MAEEETTETTEQVEHVEPTVLETPNTNYAREHRMRIGFMFSTIVLAAILIGMLSLGHYHSDQKPARARGPVGFAGRNPRGGAPGDGQGGPGGFGGGGRIGMNIKSQFFNSDGSVNKTAVTDFVNTIPSDNQSQAIARFGFVIDRSVSNQTITQAQGDQLKAAFASAANTTSGTPALG